MMGKNNKPLSPDIKYPDWILSCDCRCCESFRRDNKITEKVALESGE